MLCQAPYGTTPCFHDLHDFIGWVSGKEKETQWLYLSLNEPDQRTVFAVELQLPKNEECFLSPGVTSNPSYSSFSPRYPTGSTFEQDTIQSSSSTLPTRLSISSFPTAPPLRTVTPIHLPISLTLTHSGTNSASSLIHRIASSLEIGFVSDI